MKIKSKRLFLKNLVENDVIHFINFVKRSKALHEPWTSPPETNKAFYALLEKNKLANFQSFGIYLAETKIVIGNINLSEIVRGDFLSAYLSYYIDIEYSNKGLMKEALDIFIKYIFTDFGLHRLEANIQPENKFSIALVKSCGFIKEGFSPKYLRINGIWQDHERWAITKDVWMQENEAFLA